LKNEPGAAVNEEPRPDFTETLWKQIETKPRTTQQSGGFQDDPPVMDTVLSGIALALIAAGLTDPPSRGCLKTLIGYIPGVGFVSRMKDPKIFQKRSI
jgi:hypothetical protein